MTMRAQDEWDLQAMRGQQAHHEDRGTHHPLLPLQPDGERPAGLFAAVYDGHGGVKAVRFVRDRLFRILQRELGPGD